jgi:hypothetical protein
MVTAMRARRCAITPMMRRLLTSSEGSLAHRYSCRGSRPYKGAPMNSLPAGAGISGPLPRCDRFAVRDCRGQPGRESDRPNTAPAYYNGHPASFWMTVTRPRRKSSTPPASRAVLARSVLAASALAGSGNTFRRRHPLFIRASLAVGRTHLRSRIWRHRKGRNGIARSLSSMTNGWRTCAAT